METQELIKALAADNRRSGMPMTVAWSGAIALAVALAAGVFFAFLGPRPDIASAMQTLRFPFKIVAAIVLAVSCLGALRSLSRPETEPRDLLPTLMVAPVLIALAVIAELFAVPASTWFPKLFGTNALVCLTFIPLIGIGPLALLLLALRHGAPSHPALAGAVAGLAAGGVAAAFYASHCTDDSPLFVAIWYTMAVVILSLAGGLVARRIINW
ncbi:NrsF family protein [Sinorhizobium arboris]|uniref:NrsF family protein n=1 Tax=Sinorhizobium arboris TaxID=76745 RepID=UPI0004199B89|nr:NrsF family protein [Sinorhizobium arboris]